MASRAGSDIRYASLRCKRGNPAGAGLGISPNHLREFGKTGCLLKRLCFQSRRQAAVARLFRTGCVLSCGMLVRRCTHRLRHSFRFPILRCLRRREAGELLDPLRRDR